MLNHKHAQRGIILLEGLVAILIFSLGILAIVGLQAASMKTNADAKYRADASTLANAIIGQMWADQTNIATYAHNPGSAVCTAGVAASSNPNVANWLNNVSYALPNAASALQQINVSGPVNNRAVTVTLCWQTQGTTGWHNFVETAQISN